MAKNVGLIGLGIMGSGMARQLLAKGFGVVVWNRTADKAAALAKLGARQAASPAALAAQVEVVITMVRDDAAVRSVLLGPEGALSQARPGATFVNMSTTTPELAIELEKVFAERGFHFMDAPVTGSRAAAESGKLVVLVGGDARTLEAQRDVFEAMGQAVRHVGPIGASATLKLAINAFAASLLAVMGDALALGQASGVSREELVEEFAATAVRVVGLKKPKILGRDYSTDFALEMMSKDLDEALQTGQRAGIALPLVTAVREAYGRAGERGKAALDFSAIVDRA